ncbi:hypothetical protein J8I26_07490 [Herbaspirillum sp. LeCh32-8]|uniref:calcium-binding protein n=1 Tax=Herbaspirillum sp. LeCh32-8 TaxID=2821356 RepID=UPI001AEAC373|nr:calcium-binding protein [Herbaspirillum sp. LeCh32-8]MBP0597938.1 hypothetical protein [Herbaspirillum sp. LeCh32-8]
MARPKKPLVNQPVVIPHPAITDATLNALLSDNYNPDEIVPAYKHLVGDDEVPDELEGDSNSRNYIDGGSGDDYIVGGNAGDILVGGAGDDTIVGGLGNDLIIGGTGDDYLVGSLGFDTYVFGAGSGNDTLELVSLRPGLSKTDTLRFQDISSLNDIKMVRNDADLVLHYGASDSVTLKDMFRFDDHIGWVFRSDRPSVYVQYPYQQYGSMTFSLQEQYEKIGFNQELHGSDNGDTLRGLDGNDLLVGGAGSDKLYGGDGNDTLIGGKGDDYLEGGAGDNTYVFERGDGNDTVYLGKAKDAWGNEDTLQFKDLSSLVDIKTIIREGTDLVLRYGEADSVRVIDVFRSDEDGNFSFNDRDVSVQLGDAQKKYNLWDEYVSRNKVDTPPTQGRPEHYPGIVIDQGRVVTRGTNGDDVLRAGQYGALGNTVIGGRGNDVLLNSMNTDVFQFSVGDGNDVIARANFGSRHEYQDLLKAGRDVVKFTDVASTQLRGVQRRGESLVLEYGVSDSLTIEKYFTTFKLKGPGGKPREVTDPVQEFQFSDGVKWTAADINKQLNKPQVQTATAAASKSAALLTQAMATSNVPGAMSSGNELAPQAGKLEIQLAAGQAHGALA